MTHPETDAGYLRPTATEVAEFTSTVTDITSQPATAGTTFLAFLAVLTPVYSDGFEFQIHNDGYIDSIYATCPGCGRAHATAPHAGTGPGTGPGPAYRHLKRKLSSVSAHGPLGRLCRRLFGCACQRS